MQASEIERLILEGLPGARVKVEDLRGDGAAFSAYVESVAFEGLSRVDQHRLVFAALQGRVGGLLHSFSLRTACAPSSEPASSPEQEPSCAR